MRVSQRERKIYSDIGREKESELKSERVSQIYIERERE